ncbi:MAG: hypothetical protein HY360_18490 [Verrucomicrobia bacterium]|nr:hypothetical protein [Verrucomicrobiota bacterium]
MNTSCASMKQHSEINMPFFLKIVESETNICYDVFMIALETIVEELKSLPGKKIQEAAAFIHHLKEAGTEQKRRAFEETFGCMTPQEADEFQRVIDEGCERIESQ